MDSTQSALERTIAALLVQARSMSGERDLDAIRRLVHELRACATRAKAARLVFSEQQLTQAASSLEAKLAYGI